MSGLNQAFQHLAIAFISGPLIENVCVARYNWLTLGLGRRINIKLDDVRYAL